MEFCEMGSLQALIETKKLAPAQKVKIALDVAKGMEFLHKKEIIHRDLKVFLFFFSFPFFFFFFFFLSVFNNSYLKKSNKKSFKLKTLFKISFYSISFLSHFLRVNE